jgi:hypothetical protein
MGFVLYLIVAAIIVIPFWKIFEKAGFPPAFSLLMLIPIVNLIAIYFVAFASWPNRPSSG